MLSTRNGLGLETQNYGLGLVASGLGLVDAVASALTVWPLDCVASWPHCSVGKHCFMFCVPASSAPVERVISQSGLMMHTNRARMLDKVLDKLMFSL